MDFSVFIDECDLLVKSGQMNAVSEKIRALVFAEVPRKWRHALAKICRRTGMIERGLRLLHPIVRREAHSHEPAPTAIEICEYAVLLSRQGSVLEALGLLKDVDKTLTPEAWLYQGFCHVSHWNYAQAAEDFQRYLECAVDSYSILIAKVNLAAACIPTCQLERAKGLLSEIFEAARVTNATRLIGNCLELSAQVEFSAKNFSEARRFLNQSLEVLGQTESYDHLFIQKWRAVMVSLEENSTAELLKFRETAVARKHWESVRDTDYYCLKVHFDQKMFDHLIYGTPSEFYRARVISEISQNPSPIFHYNHAPDLEHTVDLDLKSGVLTSSNESISGTKVHQMMSIFLRELYAPRSLGALFAELYPNEYFDINSSATRVRQVLRRTRRWLEQQKIPATIEEMHGSYQLRWSERFNIRMELEKAPITIHFGLYHKALRVFEAGGVFSAEQACRQLSISRTTFHRWAAWAEENGFIAKSGNNRSTTYRLVTLQKPHVA
jgi:tetratricopeptide (TPR) repeat protein